MLSTPQNHSTTLALIEIIDNILTDLEEGNYVAGLYIDLSKAFDTVDHNILIKKLQFCGIRGQASKWFESYLSERKQFTIVNNKHSELKTIKYGVPQGSVLGPLLFLIFTNDIVNCTQEENKTRLFADDTNIFISRDNPKALKDSITTVLLDLFEWCHHNKLTINLNKTCYTVFKTKNKKIPEFLNNIKIDKVLIQKVPSAKYLGVILDENLNWEEHIDNLNKSLIKTSNSFKIIKKKIHENNKLILYYAYIYSKIQYGIEMYGRASTTTLKKVQTQQNRALKILYNKDYLTPTKALHIDLNILLIQDIYRLNVAKFVYKQKNNLLPEIFNNLYIENNQIHTHNTRQRNNLHLKHPENKYGKLKIEHQGTEIWNSLPLKIRNVKTTKNFSKKNKKYFQQLYLNN